MEHYCHQLGIGSLREFHGVEENNRKSEQQDRISIDRHRNEMKNKRKLTCIDWDNPNVVLSLTDYSRNRRGAKYTTLRHAVGVAT